MVRSRRLKVFATEHGRREGNSTLAEGLRDGWGDLANEELPAFYADRQFITVFTTDGHFSLS